MPSRFALRFIWTLMDTQKIPKQIPTRLHIMFLRSVVRFLQEGEQKCRTKTMNPHGKSMNNNVMMMSFDGIN